MPMRADDLLLGLLRVNQLIVPVFPEGNLEIVLLILNQEILRMILGTWESPSFPCPVRASHQILKTSVFLHIKLKKLTLLLKYKMIPC